MLKSQLIDIDGNSQLAVMSLNRPERANAFNAELIAAITDECKKLKENTKIRVLILRAEGKHFSAGADLNWMKAAATLSYEENVSDAKRLAAMFAGIASFPAPTIALVHGSAFGGAVGIAACADITFADPGARFCLSEVKLGLLPAVIGPYLAQRMQAPALRRLALTAKVFSAVEAQQFGLVHEVVPVAAWADRLGAEVKSLLAGGPQGQRAFKELHRLVLELDPQVFARSAEWIAKARVGEEGQQGLNAFFAGNKPVWALDGVDLSASFKALFEDVKL